MNMKLLVVLITCSVAAGRVPCIDNCDQPKSSVCGFDRRLGAKLFDNLCCLDAWNLCYHTGRVPCIDNCDQPKSSVCGFDRRLGAKLFDNLCCLDSWNLCYHTDYEALPTVDDCTKMYDEEYSRESMIPFKNPLILEMYKNNKLDNLYL